jgi:hypothetical protein
MKGINPERVDPAFKEMITELFYFFGELYSKLNEKN